MPILSPTTCQTWPPKMTMLHSNYYQSCVFDNQCWNCSDLGSFYESFPQSQTASNFGWFRHKFTQTRFISPSLLHHSWSLMPPKKNHSSCLFKGIGFLLCFHPTISTWWADVRPVLLPVGQHEGSALRAEQSTWCVRLAALRPVGRWRLYTGWSHISKNNIS